MSAESYPTPIQRASGNLAQWLIVALLAAIAGGLWLRGEQSGLPAAVAQNAGLAGARGVYAFTGPIDRDQYGLFMLDVDEGTVWCYAFDNVDGTRKLRLVAARTWVYDRYLKDFNCAAPDFRTVQQLVSEQRSRPTSESVPRPSRDGAGSPPGREAPGP